MDKGFIGLLQSLEHESVALSHPGVFLFLPYLKRLKIYEKAGSLIEVDPDRGYSWFSLSAGTRFLMGSTWFWIKFCEGQERIPLTYIDSQRTSAGLSS